MDFFLNHHTYHLPSFLSPLRATSNASLSRCLSTPTTHEVSSASPASQFAVQYLVNSCGLPPDYATRASRYLPHLKSPEKCDSVLQFLRQEAGVTEPHIRAAAIRDPSFLCFSVDKCLRPRIAELQEIGFSPSHISLLISICPMAFKYTKLLEKVRFWMTIFGSVDRLLRALKKGYFLLTVNLETCVIPNLSFLQDQCGLSARQIARLLDSVPRLITSTLAALEIKAKRAEELGIPRSSGMFLYALILVSSLKQSTLDAKVLYLRSLGFGQEEVASMIRKAPFLLIKSKESLHRKMKFLMKEAHCDKFHVVQNPVLFMYSLEKRLIPRNLVRKLLEAKGLPAGKLMSFMNLSEVKFVKKFVLPYEHSIPGIYQAYRDACAENNPV